MFRPPGKCRQTSHPTAEISTIQNQIRPHHRVMRPPKGIEHLVRTWRPDVQGAQRRHAIRYARKRKMVVTGGLDLAAIARK
jgi:hypothetical protein